MTSVRELSTETELREAVALQKTIWGWEDADLLPFRMFVVATKIGGQLLGAFDADRMIAFCVAIPGLKPGGKVYLHSHMLGVLPEYRRQGIASQLMEAVHSWARLNDYESIRFECHNQHRPMLHLAITLEYDIVGMRWDPERNANLLLFQKVLRSE